ncbi:MAG: hypothetical protein OXU73_00540 [Candidatus Campbellbacteria bacterium]|nr:hypothetical protein [Candidatus Campbellbacteria bacterium]
MGIKDFFYRKAMESKLKKLPPEQREFVERLIEKNPQLFKEINDQIEKRKKEGQDETLASIAVMKQYRQKIIDTMK